MSSPKLQTRGGETYLRFHENGVIQLGILFVFPKSATPFCYTSAMFLFLSLWKTSAFAEVGQVLEIIMEKIHQILRGYGGFGKLPTIFWVLSRKEQHLVWKKVASSLNLFIPLAKLVLTW